MASLVLCWRRLFLGDPASPVLLTVALAWAVLIFVIGFCVYRSLEWKFAEVV
jgi:ABC-type polysaccharide/polyol phosphate export permease